MRTSAVICHASARDYYQAAWALNEAGLLTALVTDIYFDPAQWRVPRRLLAACPKLGARNCPGLRSSQVRTTWTTVRRSMIQRFAPSRDRQIALDWEIGQLSRRLAAQTNSGLLSYSYYAAAAFAPGPELPSKRVLFQLHPHPASIRQLLREELERVPAAAASLKWEHEVGSTEEHFQSLCREPMLANGWIAASSFTARTLIEHGVPEEQIQVVPYGVSAKDFPARKEPRPFQGPLRLIWVGSVVQRKGLSYLLEALRRFDGRDVELVICTHALIDAPLLKRFNLPNVRVLTGLPRQSVVEELHNSDLFVLPSLAEGFGHVILEAMSSGLPVLTTPNTCGPDVMVEGGTGLIVPLRDAAAIAGRIEWAMSNRERLFEMGQEAARAAKGFTWERFRRKLVGAYRKATEPAPISAAFGTDRREMTA